MAIKRTVEELQASTASLQQDPFKRTRPSPPQLRDSSASSNGPMSEASALRSSPTVSGDRARQSSVTSVDSSVTEGEDLQSSSSEEGSVVDSEDEDEEEDEIVTIGGPKKPRIVGGVVLGGAQDLRARVSALLPRLAAANRDLEASGGAMSMEEVQDGEQHIEMDLGLGVLEEKNASDDSSSGSESDDESDGEELSATDMPLAPNGSLRRAEKDGTVLNKLMGRKPQAPANSGIQELG